VVNSSSADPLPGTKPLTESGDLARKMVDGIHKYLDRELAAAPEKRDAVKPDRERLRKLLGVVDERVSPRLETIAPLHGSAVAGRPDGCEVTRVRWAVLPGVDAEGLYIRGGTDKVVAHVVAVPHAGQTPEELAGLKDGDAFALRLARNGCDVLIPTLIDRADTFSANPKLNRATNQPHREFAHRMAYEMGRTLIGYEVQKVLGAADWFTRSGKSDVPLGVLGYGDGGRVALYAGALDERFAVSQVAGAFGPQETCWRRPLDRNLFGLLTEFGDAEVGALVAPRKLIVVTTPGPRWPGPTDPKPGRSGAAPGSLGPVAEADLGREFDRLRKRAGNAATRATGGKKAVNTDAFLAAVGVAKPVKGDIIRDVVEGIQSPKFDDPPEVVQKRQFDQLVAYSQKLWRDSEAVRKEFWKKADASSPEAWEKSCDWYRDYFHREVIGKLPDPTVPMNPRTRVVYDEPNWTGYEVVLDVYTDVIASGILLLPKDLKPGERRPVVVCQHGLEGRPRNTIDVEKRAVYNHLSRRLADLGYIVYAPQNPYIFEDHFRQLQRKANPLKLSLFSFIIAQHRRTLDWLETLPNVDPKRIGFYGLSYGGKTAMRVPAVEKRYCLSICAGDFNEWVGKCVSVGLDRSYMWTREYDMYEFDLGNTFNYAEMAYLIAPRPFMVERGHDDGVGTDEMIAYEYARVRYLYANKLKIPDRTAIEFNPGGHEVFLKGTLTFLVKHLGKPRP
jgi:dienelactone hydrolase